MMVKRTVMMALAALYFALPAYSYDSLEDRRDRGRFQRQTGRVRFDESKNQVRRFHREDPPKRLNQRSRTRTHHQTRATTHARGNTHSSTRTSGVRRPRSTQPRSINPNKRGNPVASNPGANHSSNRTRAGGRPGQKHWSSSRPKPTSGNSRIASSRTTRAPKKVKSPYKGLGGATAALTAGGLAAGTWHAMKQNEEDYKSGKISKAQYRQRQEQQLLGDGATLARLKKMSPANMLMNDVIGTDPISLGADIIGDLRYGTGNTKETLKNMGKAFDKSLVKQTFTDPKGAVKRVGDDLKDAGKKVGDGLKKIGGIFKKKK